MIMVYIYIYIIGASLSEPNIGEFAVEFVYMYISAVHHAIGHFRHFSCVLV